jgi:tetratricopeptide (TPR) repeat protein
VAVSDQTKRLRQRAKKLRQDGNWSRAREAYISLLKILPDDVDAQLDLGYICMQLEDFHGASRVYARMLEKNPRNAVVLANLGGALLRLGQPSEAKSVIEFALELDPKNIYARINLGGVLQSQGDLRAALANALEAVAIDPTHPLAFNNLGSALNDLALFNEAKHAYETSILLEPRQIDALINLAGVESKIGDASESTRRYEEVICLLPEEAVERRRAVEFFAAFEYLKVGNLKKGWDYYDGGFSPMVPLSGARSPKRVFEVPRWDGESLDGKRLLVWREQGLGDELMFATCLPELANLNGTVIVESDPRLVGALSRSFPQFLIRAESFLPGQGMQSFYNDFDLHVPLGSLMRYFRRDLVDFGRSNAFIKVDPEKMVKFSSRLAPYKKEHRLVGICWRSGKVDPVRSLGYTQLDEWGEVLQNPNVKFVNLQYGDCERELCAAEEKYGVEILRWPDVDLKDHLDDVFALMACLDLVVSVQTAVLMMAGAVGVRTVGFRSGGWSFFGLTDRDPWNLRKQLIYDFQSLQQCLLHLEPVDS